MKNFRDNPISSILGLAMVFFAGYLLFTPTLYDIPLYVIGLIAISGILLFSAQDKFVSILTLGLDRFVKKSTGNDNEENNKMQKGIGGELPKDDDENP